MEDKYLLGKFSKICEMHAMLGNLPCPVEIKSYKEERGKGKGTIMSLCVSERVLVAFETNPKFKESLETSYGGSEKCCFCKRVDFQSCHTKRLFSERP